VLVTVHPGEGQCRYPVVREGEPTDSYDGWRVDEVVPDKDAGDGHGDDHATRHDHDRAPTTTAPPPPQTVGQKVVAYNQCIEGRGAKGVKQALDPPPSVSFSGGGSEMIAAFAADDTDAQQGFATIQRRKPFLVQRYGTVVLYSVGDPARRRPGDRARLRGAVGGPRTEGAVPGIGQG